MDSIRKDLEHREHRRQFPIFNVNYGGEEETDYDAGIIDEPEYVNAGCCKVCDETITCEHMWQSINDDDEDNPKSTPGRVWTCPKCYSHEAAMWDLGYGPDSGLNFMVHTAASCSKTAIQKGMIIVRDEYGRPLQKEDFHCERCKNKVKWYKCTICKEEITDD